MNIAAWIILGLAVAWLARRLVPESRTWGPPALPAIVGMAGAVAGGWTASILIVRPFAGGSLSLATWPAAVAGAVPSAYLYGAIALAAGALLGSVSQHCVQHALCPVVVVRGPDPA